MIGRRSTLLGGLVGGPLAAMSYADRAQASISSAFENLLINGADPTGNLDSAPAMVAAYNKLPSTGGVILCPAGIYALGSQCNFSSKPVAIFGLGSSATVFTMKHGGTAFSFAQQSVYDTVSISGIGIAGATNGPQSAGAISISMPPSLVETGYQSCVIDDVSIGVPFLNATGGCNILLGLYLKNIWKSHISNVRMFSPLGNGVGTFVNLAADSNGTSIDNRFIACSADGVNIGMMVTGAAQGLHLIDSLMICDYGFSSNYGNYGAGININGLYVRGCEFNCVQKAADLFQVWTGHVSDSHFGSSSATIDAVVSLTGTVNLLMANIYVTGVSGPTVYGMNLQPSSAAGCAINKINGVTFENLSNGLIFNFGSSENLALGIQMVNQSIFPRLMSSNVAVDVSNNYYQGVNNAQWQTDLGKLQTLY